MLNIVKLNLCIRINFILSNYSIPNSLIYIVRNRVNMIIYIFILLSFYSLICIWFI